MKSPNWKKIVHEGSLRSLLKTTKSFYFSYRPYSIEKNKLKKHENEAFLLNKQKLYMFSKYSPGSVLLLPHGTRIINKLFQFIKNQQINYGFEEVLTPIIYKTSLWKKSGHWNNYKEDIFKIDDHENNEKKNESDEKQYGLKPMNCPAHCLIFSSIERSYAELPIRYSDFGLLHRSESRSAISGMTRLKSFHQDDGHIFCTFNQIETEIENTIKLALSIYNVFKIDTNSIEFCLSTRPEKNYIGEIETWNKAESILKSVLNNCIKKDCWKVNDGDGAFYGPKIDILISDKFNKKNQIGTIQLDFQLPKRFNLKYTSKNGSNNNEPVLIHRAIFGSFERFFATLIDKYDGNWPFWLSPRQAIVISVSSKYSDYAEEIKNKLCGQIDVKNSSISLFTNYRFYVDVDKRNESVKKKVRDAIEKGYNYLIVIGEKEFNNKILSIKEKNQTEVEALTQDQIYQKFIELEKNYK